MNLDANSILASLLIGGVGFVVFAYGKKQRRPPQLLTGLILMVFPYFVGSVPWMVGVAAALLAALWISVRMGL
jgi:hypothetical protein